MRDHSERVVRASEVAQYWLLRPRLVARQRAGPAFEPCGGVEDGNLGPPPARPSGAQDRSHHPLGLSLAGTGAVRGPGVADPDGGVRVNSWLALFVVFLGVGLALLWLARRGHTRSGIPRGHIIYTDVGTWQKVERPLFSKAHRLTGKPDYLVAEGRELIPVEVKTGGTPIQPYRSHVLQLAAYCLLIEANYGQRPSYGVVTYPDRAFALDYTGELERELLATLEHMRSDLATGNADRRHQALGRCRACGYRQACDQALV